MASLPHPYMFEKDLRISNNCKDLLFVNELRADDWSAALPCWAMAEE